MSIALPSGEYTDEVMGGYFPRVDPAEIEGLAAGRFEAASNHRGYAELNQAALDLLTGQSGATADDMRQQHLRAIASHGRTAARNEALGTAYVEIAQIVRTLQIELNEIALAVNLAIQAVQKSTMRATDKVAAITNLIEKAKAYVQHKVAQATFDINSKTRAVLQADGNDAKVDLLQSGVDPSTLPDGGNGSPYLDANRPIAHEGINGVENFHNHTPGPEQVSGISTGQNAGPLDRENPFQSHTQPATGIPTTVVPTPNLTPTSVPSTPQTPSIGTPMSTSTPASSASPRIDAPSSTTSPLNPQAQLNQLRNNFTDGLVQGMQNPVPTVPVSPVATTQPMAMDQPSDTSQSPSAPSYATAAASPVNIDHPTPVVASPAPIAAAAPAAPIGPLPAYGADIRPSTPVLASAPAPPVPSVPTVAQSVASAPTSASSSAMAQPAVVRQAPLASAQTGVPVASEAAFATATGAMAGQINQQSIEQDRLHRLVDSVARQEPGLRWAVGNRDDGSTVIITDLASGWIPPGIEIPVGVDVLQPERRRGDLASLLGGVSLTAAYSPGQYIAPSNTVDPLNMSDRALRVPAIDDLGWELGQATNWRDGLPRLAHTLAKAAIAGTGVLDSEADLLSQNLSAVREQIMASYPDHHPGAVANYMLLAAIAALITGDKSAANYHFAWFQAINTAAHIG